MASVRCSVLAGLILVLALCQEASAQCTELSVVTASNGGTSDQFGVAVDVDGSVMVCGAHLEDTNGVDAGAAYVYEFDGTAWVETAMLTAGVLGGADDRFGRSVAVSGQVIVIGAPLNDAGASNAGAAYVFEKLGGSWTLVQRLTASNGTAADEFGFSVAVDGSTLVVGAHFDDFHATDSGSAYAYVRTAFGWLEQAQLVPLSGSTSDSFGQSVSIGGDVIVIGAHGDDETAQDAGAAFVYRNSGSGWSFESKLRALDGAALDSFGIAVDVEGDRAVVGSLLDDDAGSESGSAYVFVYDSISSWQQESKLVASDAAAGDRFGVSVSISGSTVVCGAYLDDLPESSAGSAYQFRNCGGSWVQERKLAASSRGTGDQTGLSISVQGNRTVLGSYLDDPLGPDSGSAFLFSSADVEVIAPASLSVSSGSLLGLSIVHGNQGDPVLIQLSAIDGVPLVPSLNLILFGYGPDCKLNVSAMPLPGLAGHTLAFRALEIGACGALVLSQPATVAFLP